MRPTKKAFPNIIQTNVILPLIRFTCLIWFLNTIHQSILLCDLFFIYKLQHNYVGSYLIRLIVNFININFL